MHFVVKELPDLSDIEEDEIDTKKISWAPLHRSWKHRRAIPTKKLKVLLRKGYLVNRGRWTAKEDRRLEKNWNRICRCHPGFSDPFEAFGVIHRPEGYVDREVRKTHREYRTFRFMQRMAYKLDKRLICDIYNRCKLKFAFSQFKYISQRQLPEELLDSILKDIKAHESVHSISTKYNISPKIITTLKARRLKEGKRFCWKDEDDCMLECAIERVCNNTDPTTIPTYKINWREVEREMRSCGYKLVARQMYTRWIRRYRNLVNLRNKLDEDQSELINNIPQN